MRLANREEGRRARRLVLCDAKDRSTGKKQNKIQLKDERKNELRQGTERRKSLVFFVLLTFFLVSLLVHTCAKAALPLPLALYFFPLFLFMILSCLMEPAN